MFLNTNLIQKNNYEQLSQDFQGLFISISYLNVEEEK